jgi:hypothetical protein
MKKTFPAFILVLCFYSRVFGSETITSPDGRITLAFELADTGAKKKHPVYSIAYRENPLIARSGLGFNSKTD